MAKNENGSVIVDYTTDLIGVWKVSLLVHVYSFRIGSTHHINENYFFRKWKNLLRLEKQNLLEFVI